MSTQLPARRKGHGGKRERELPKGAQDALRDLHDALREGMATETVLWNFHTLDWVTSVVAADIDNDGDIETVIGVRNGDVIALTRWGSRKWKQHLETAHISALCLVPGSNAETDASGTATLPTQVARIIVGMRNGDVIALNENGDPIPGWFYPTGRMIRQLYISPQTPGTLIIGSEDRYIHVLDSANGCPLRPAFQTDGWVRCVFACDLDGDGQEEILAGSGDTRLYVLNSDGSHRTTLHVGHQIYALFAAPLEAGGPIQIVTSSNRKDLTAWRVSCDEQGNLEFHKSWEKTPDDHLFDNRVHSIYIADLNDNHRPRILVGSEDGHLYILDHHGNPLWKHNFGSCIYSVYAADIDFDGQIEVLVGTEDQVTYALHVELEPDQQPYAEIRITYDRLCEILKQRADNEIARHFTPRERNVLHDIVASPQIYAKAHKRLEMETALRLLHKGSYEKALKLLTRLRQQKMQYYWSHPWQVRGYIWTLGIGQLLDNGRQQIIIGTDEKMIYTRDIEQDEPLWQRELKGRVRMIEVGTARVGQPDIIAAVLSNHHVVILDHQGSFLKEHSFPDKQDWARSIYFHTVKSPEQDHPVISEILIGQENRKISIWNPELNQQLSIIDTPQGIGAVLTHDLSGNGTAEIISGSIQSEVFVHNRQGQLLWEGFKTRDRVQSLCAEDIDRDGQVEIIVGSEDRNVYVLDAQGHLKWRYRTQRGVMDIDICDIKAEGDPEEAHLRKRKLLVSSSDSFLYILSADGDLLWTYQGMNRIRAVRAQDLNADGNIEIAVASENQLELLQLFNRREMFGLINECWGKLLAESDDPHAAHLALTYHSNKYLRGFALARLAGLHNQTEDDRKRLLEALRREDALEVKTELVRAIAILHKGPRQDGRLHLARQFLQYLSAAPEDEIRLAIVDILSTLDEGLCFEYLTYFTHNVDMWVRRAVVRQLDKLVERYPKRVFQLLQRTAHDEEEWVRQESARTLAHYFDTHLDRLVFDLLALLYSWADIEVLRQIAYSARVPIVRRMFESLVALLLDLDAAHVVTILDQATEAIRQANQYEPAFGEELLQIYEVLRLLFQPRTIATIARQQWYLPTDIGVDTPTSSFAQISSTLDGLHQVTQIIRTYERREAVGDRATSLLTALGALDRLHNGLRQEEMRLTGTRRPYRLPEFTVLGLLLERWSEIIRAELYRLRGDAELRAEIRNTSLPPSSEVVISLLLSNHGRSPADNVRVILEEQEDFTLLSPNEQVLTEVSTTRPAAVEFTIRTNRVAPRLSFQIFYDDAEKRSKPTRFASVVPLQDERRPFRQIPNPYTSGIPILDRKMFYGREEDLETLGAKLSGSNSNKVVVLSGQRRMGKTSLLYHLAQDLALKNYAPVLIDVQGSSLVNNVGQFLENIASRIQSQLLTNKQLKVALPSSLEFQQNPTAAFDGFIEMVLRVADPYKPVLMFDEFEKLQEQIQKGTLDEDILSYLRSLMQHRHGLSFLLAGSPRIRFMTEGRWSVFFNIALYHRLARLKPAEATALFTEPLAGFLDYDSLALERLHQLTGDQPYLIHVFSEHVITYCNKQHKNYVTVNDIHIVLDLMLDEQMNSVYWIWEQATPNERFLLSVLARDKGEDGRVFSQNDIREEFDMQGLPYEPQQVKEALDKLTREDIIEERLHGTQYRIPVGFVRAWIRRAKPPERVMREELAFDD